MVSGTLGGPHPRLDPGVNLAIGDVSLFSDAPVRAVHIFISSTPSLPSRQGHYQFALIL
jgi:hypothetical protein